MSHYSHWCSVALALLTLPAFGWAEQVRYRYVPLNACNTTTQAPIGPEGTIGELKRGFGAIPLPYPYAVRPTHMVTFRHAFNGRLMTIPLRLPDGPPRIEQRSDRILYNYPEYIIEIRFLPDGAADVTYNSGFLNPLRFE